MAIPDPNGGPLFVKLLLTVCTAALIGMVGALWSITAHLAALDERVASWTRIFETRFEGLQTQVHTIQDHQRTNEMIIQRNTTRIDNIERAR